MSLNLNPEIEAQLIGLAQASGVSVEDFLLHVIADKKVEVQELREATSAWELPPEEWVRKFDTWAESHAALNLPILSDDDISRESIYADRGL
jgi:hypothetical protein